MGDKTIKTVGLTHVLPQLNCGTQENIKQFINTWHFIYRMTSCTIGAIKYGAMMIKIDNQSIQTTLRRWNKKFATAHHNHDYHRFAHEWQRRCHDMLNNFATGQHVFEPMKAYNFAGKIEPMWSLADSLFMKLLFRHIQPTFKHIISKHCHHLHGPNRIKAITHIVSSGLENNLFGYVTRSDIKSFLCQY